MLEACMIRVYPFWCWYCSLMKTRGFHDKWTSLTTSLTSDLGEPNHGDKQILTIHWLMWRSSNEELWQVSCLSADLLYIDSGWKCRHLLNRPANWLGMWNTQPWLLKEQEGWFEINTVQYIVRENRNTRNYSYVKFYSDNIPSPFWNMVVKWNLRRASG
jgi:hypothetical protein